MLIFKEEVYNMINSARHKYKKHLRGLSIGIFIFLSTSPIWAQNEAAETLKKANNPLADLTALNFHNYYIPKLTDAPSDAYFGSVLQSLIDVLDYNLLNTQQFGF